MGLLNPWHSSRALPVLTSLAPHGLTRWRDGLPVGALVLMVHAGLIGGAVLGFGASRPQEVITPPSITGVLVAEASQKLAQPEQAQVSRPEPEPPAPPPKPKPKPLSAVKAPPTERSVTVAQAPEPKPQPEPDVAETPRETPPAAAPSMPSTSEADAAPPVTPPLADAAYLQNPAPVYPSQSRRRREEGQVLLEVFILVDGGVGNVRVKRSSGYPALDEAALDAVRRWRFVPARRGNEAIPYLYELPVGFSLRR